MAPTAVKATSDRIAIDWNDGHAATYTARDLRLACRCAHCIDEWTNENKIHADQIPTTIKPKAITPVGNYALSFHWSDGHDSGIYTYDYLRQICGCDACRKPREFDV